MPSTEAVTVGPPLRGEWAIFNPPGHPPLAFDFLATRGDRRPEPGPALFRHVVTSIPVDATYAWGRPVYAPLDGVVVASSDGTPDRQRISLLPDLAALLLFPPRPGAPFSACGGNHVILKCGEVYPLFAHLRCGSVRVRAGDQVRAGDVLGEVGNSGASLQPHLHFQVMRTPDPLPLYENLVPFRLSAAQRRIGDSWIRISNAELGNGDHLQL